jgi:hypothetical protein
MAWCVLNVSGGGSIGCLVGHRSGAQGPIRHGGAVKPSQSPDGSSLRSIGIGARRANKPQPQSLTQRYLHPAGAAGLCPLDFIRIAPLKMDFPAPSRQITVTKQTNQRLSPSIPIMEGEFRYCPVLSSTKCSCGVPCAVYEIYVARAARAAAVQARRGGFGGCDGAARPKRRFVNSSPVCVAAAHAPAGRLTSRESPASMRHATPSITAAVVFGSGT